MINVRLKGRLGNILFQYAVGRHLAIKNNTKLKLNFKYYKNRQDPFGRRIRNILDSFNIDPKSYKKVGPESILNYVGINWPFRNNNVYKDNDKGFSPEVLILGNGTTLDGYFQSENYFKEIEAIIRDDLQIKNGYFGKESDDYKERVLSGNSVSLHVRRGDYLREKNRNICNANYFSKSVDYMRENLKTPHFFVFSDDIEWCINNLELTDCTFVKIPGSGKNPVIDLQLMSLCKHNIISNSSFSWWGAWLNKNKEKIVVAPDRWGFSDKPDSKVMLDRLPEDWVRINF